jgi:DNA-binding transcriptional MerR regulator
MAADTGRSMELGDDAPDDSPFDAHAVSWQLKFASTQGGSVVDVLDIAELGRRTGTAPSALRYYERLGLVTPVGRIAGRRSYAATAAERVAMIRLFQDTGFTLAEIATLLRVNAGRKGTWSRFAQAKIDELEQRIVEARKAKTLLEHSIRCPAPNILDCPRFQQELHARLDEDAVASHS